MPPLWKRTAREVSPGADRDAEPPLGPKLLHDGALHLSMLGPEIELRMFGDRRRDLPLGQRGAAIRAGRIGIGDKSVFLVPMECRRDPDLVAAVLGLHVAPDEGGRLATLDHAALAHGSGNGVHVGPAVLDAGCNQALGGRQSGVVAIDHGFPLEEQIEHPETSLNRSFIMRGDTGPRMIANTSLGAFSAPSRSAAAPVAPVAAETTRPADRVQAPRIGLQPQPAVQSGSRPRGTTLDITV